MYSPMLYRGVSDEVGFVCIVNMYVCNHTFKKYFGHGVLLEPKSGPESTFLRFMKYCKSNINDDIFSPSFIFFFYRLSAIVGPRLSPKNVCFLLYIYICS